MTRYGPALTPSQDSVLRLDTATRAMKGLTKKQRDAMDWLWPTSKRQWHTTDCGDPAIGSLDSLVRRGLATKTGSSGMRIYFEMTDTGRLALALSSQHHSTEAG